MSPVWVVSVDVGGSGVRSSTVFPTQAAAESYAAEVNGVVSQREGDPSLADLDPVLKEDFFSAKGKGR